MKNTVFCFREPPIPEKVRQHCYVNVSAHSEVQLTEDQEKQTVEMIAAAYGMFSDNPSIPVSLPDPPSADDSSQSPNNLPEMAERKKLGVKQGKPPGKRSFRKRCGRPRLQKKEEVEERESEMEKEAEEEVVVEGTAGYSDDGDDSDAGNTGDIIIIV